MDSWPLWGRVAFANIIGAVSVAIGFASSDVKLSPSFSVPIAVFILAIMNFLFLVVRPRVIAAKAAGHPVLAWEVVGRIVRQRPLILLLVINQLTGVSQLLKIVAIVAPLLISGRIHALPNMTEAKLRMIPISISVLTGVAAIWLLSAIGLWLRRSWAWWLALCLNALAGVVTVGVGLLAVFVLKHGFSLDWREVTTTIACLLLLLPAVRNDVLRRGRDVVTT